MRRTRHHKGQKHRHNGHDYGARYKCNKTYGCPYGVEGRDLADSERRREAKKVIQEGLDEAVEFLHDKHGGTIKEISKYD